MPLVISLHLVEVIRCGVLPWRSASERRMLVCPGGQVVEQLSTNDALEVEFSTLARRGQMDLALERSTVCFLQLLAEGKDNMWHRRRLQDDLALTCACGSCKQTKSDTVKTITFKTVEFNFLYLSEGCCALAPECSDGHTIVAALERSSPQKAGDCLLQKGLPTSARSHGQNS